MGEGGEQSAIKKWLVKGREREKHKHEEWINKGLRTGGTLAVGEQLEGDAKRGKDLTGGEKKKSRCWLYRWGPRLKGIGGNTASRKERRFSG